MFEEDILSQLEELRYKDFEPTRVSFNPIAFDELCFSYFRKGERMPTKIYGLNVVVYDGQKEKVIVY